MNSRELQRLIAADIELSGDGLKIQDFAQRHGVNDKTARRLLDFIAAEFDVSLEYVHGSYRWKYGDDDFRIFDQRLG